MSDERPDPTNCDRCNASLERGWSERWRDNKRVGTVCLDCDRKERRKRYAKDGVLTTQMLIDAAIYHSRFTHGETPRDVLLERAWLGHKRVRGAAKMFETDVWFGGLRKVVRDARYRGHRAEFEANGVKAKALVWSCAGRVMFTLEPADESYSVTLITAEDEDKPVMGIRGICATWQQATALIDAATKLRTADFKRDDKIGMF